MVKIPFLRFLRNWLRTKVIGKTLGAKMSSEKDFPGLLNIWNTAISVLSIEFDETFIEVLKCVYHFILKQSDENSIDMVILNGVVPFFDILQSQEENMQLLVILTNIVSWIFSKSDALPESTIALIGYLLFTSPVNSFSAKISEKANFIKEISKKLGDDDIDRYGWWILFAQQFCQEEGDEFTKYSKEFLVHLLCSVDDMESRSELLEYLADVYLAKEFDDGMEVDCSEEMILGNAVDIKLFSMLSDHFTSKESLCLNSVECAINLLVNVLLPGTSFNDSLIPSLLIQFDSSKNYNIFVLCALIIKSSEINCDSIITAEQFKHLCSMVHNDENGSKVKEFLQLICITTADSEKATILTSWVLDWLKIKDDGFLKFVIDFIYEVYGSDNQLFIKEYFTNHLDSLLSGLSCKDENINSFINYMAQFK
ncbi:hypothetical protein ROZALSC1DRAFT_29067 [Rozella allomycis CSF55]|uniref:Uncharacterized protein n=1 Tax=Rozella allomycis (strain CSF55) TaxID=988480 RepID=A0A4P9YIY8_ROZAC|nr:hypothetical protein ROZALSC1DRAFT_29067 [Rozella allomycis CSF55]